MSLSLIKILISPLKKRFWLIYYSSSYAVLVLLFCGLITDLEKCYSISPYFRSQTEAFLQGRLSLSNDAHQLKHDLCWSECGIHQVWGLGIPLWRLPWDATFNHFAKRGFPDWIALGLWITLTSYLLLHTFTKIKPNSNIEAPFSVKYYSAVLALMFFPPVMNLMHTRMHVYEEVLAYEYFFGLGLFSVLLKWSIRPSTRLLCFLCFVAGLSGLFRPTLFFYGLSAVFIAFAGIFVRSRLSVKTNILSLSNCFAVSLFLMGGAILWLTNYLRFGNGFEFGHSLNLQSGTLLGSIYATRFDYPFLKESFCRAGKELLGALFAVQHFNGPEWYESNIYLGQSPTIRWREFYFYTFDISYIPLIFAGWGIGLWDGWKYWKSAHSEYLEKGGIPWSTIISAWSFLSTGILALFYMRTPAISSRYIMDFAPSFASAIFVLIVKVQQSILYRRYTVFWYNHILLLLTILWIGIELILGRNSIYGPPNSIPWSEVRLLNINDSSTSGTISLPGSYRQGSDLTEYNIPFNGSGWNTKTGSVDVAVILFIDSPECLEMYIDSTADIILTKEQLSRVRANIGTEHLIKKSITHTESGWRISFAGPQQLRYQHGLQPLFLAMVDEEHLADKTTPLILKCVSWHY